MTNHSQVFVQMELRGKRFLILTNIVNMFFFPLTILLNDLNEKVTSQNEKRVSYYPSKFEWLGRVFARNGGSNVVCAM